MASGFVIRKNQYYDSLFLMAVTKRISDVEGVSQSAVVMATESNKEVLADIGISAPEIGEAGPSDLVTAVISDSQSVVDDVLTDLDTFLQGGVQAASTSNPHTIEEGLELSRNANLAVISVPGEYAAREARKALDAGVNVFLFSDNVTIEDEVELKQHASDSGLIVMGPDCGTAILGGVGIGFANVVRRGPIGAIAASGTGLQEFTSQVHNLGSGISHGIGTGGRDLSDQVGGITTLTALDALEGDPQTEVIVLISKPPGTTTLAKVSERLASCAKPAIACFIGAETQEAAVGPFICVASIDDAVNEAIRIAGAGTAKGPEAEAKARLKRPAQDSPRWNDDQKYLRGVFAGGTFCYQSQHVLQSAGFSIHSNAPLAEDSRLSDSNTSVEHTIVDMGADEYTTGRPHPMMEGSSRAQRIVRESEDPQTAILLLDFILGYNSSSDPVGELLEAIATAQHNAKARGGELPVVASVCGTDLDPQPRADQIKKLVRAGVVVFDSNFAATEHCAGLLQK